MARRQDETLVPAAKCRTDICSFLSNTKKNNLRFILFVSVIDVNVTSGSLVSFLETVVLSTKQRVAKRHLIEENRAKRLMASLHSDNAELNNYQFTDEDKSLLRHLRAIYEQNFGTVSYLLFFSLVKFFDVSYDTRNNKEKKTQLE